MTYSNPRLSVLDLIPVDRGQRTADAVAASLELARAADRAGYVRYWFAEHHNMASVASTSPPVAIALALQATSRIRVGSGGVMLPNHSPLVVAEQFALLEAAAPGRVDLALGRAPGSDPVVTAVLQRSGPTSGAAGFPDSVADIDAMLSADGVDVRLTTGGPYSLRSTPAASSVPELWLLGSSDYSAELAAARGLPYVFASHFAGDGLARALERYRSGFRPSARLDRPRTILTANAVVAETAAEADRRAQPQLQQMARLRTNEKLGPLATIEEAEAAELTELQTEIVAAMRSGWAVGTAEDVAGSLSALAAAHDIDEVMISPVAGRSRDEDPRVVPSRIATVEALAAVMG